MYITYVTVNKITGEYYFGSHKQETDEFDGYFGSGRFIRESLEKYGKDSLVRKTIACFDNRKESIDLEHKLIRNKKKNQKCQNRSSGGQSFDYINKNLTFDRSAFGKLASHEYQENLRIQNMDEYNKDPKKCIVCGKIIDYDRRMNKFCSKSCAASFNNSKRKKYTVCEYCGKTIEQKYPRRRFCNNRCSSLYMNANKHTISEKRKLLFDNKDYIYSLKDSGFTYRQIASEFDVSANYVKEFFKGRLDNKTI